MSKNFYDLNSVERGFKRDFMNDVIKLLISILIIAFIIFGSTFTNYGNNQTIEGTVVEKYIKRSGSGKNSKDSYMVNIETKEGDIIVLSNEDRFFKFKFDSSDIQAELQEGKTYRIDVCGRRIRLLSSYQNIIDVEEVE